MAGDAVMLSAYAFGVLAGITAWASLWTASLLLVVPVVIFAFVGVTYALAQPATALAVRIDARRQEAVDYR